MSSERDQSISRLAVEKGFLTVEQAHEADDALKALQEKGQPLPLGAWLVQNRMLTSGQLQALITECDGTHTQAEVLEVSPASGDPEDRDLFDIPKTIGQYEVLEEIGRGGMGVVYRAQQMGMNRAVALKLVYPIMSSDKVTIARFEREAQLAGRLSHENIVPIFDFGKDKGLFYYAMQIIEGRSISVLLEEEPFPIERSAEIMHKVVRALDHAHRKGVLHRDVKPENILMTEEGRVALTDFGLAKAVGSQGVTASGQVLGTPVYMSPEQATGAEDSDARTDVYMSGATLYHMVTGQPPFKDGPLYQLLLAVRNDEPRTPRSIRPDCPESMERIILKAMAKNPESRYQTAAALADDLEAFVRGASHEPKPAVRRRRGGTTARRRPTPGGPWGRRPTESPEDPTSD